MLAIIAAFIFLLGFILALLGVNLAHGISLLFLGLAVLSLAHVWVLPWDRSRAPRA
jgi:uncharacterized membrane protein YecN with MAPEG domain